MREWRTVGVYEIEPETVNGVQWGSHLVIQKLGYVKRPSKGWRRHVRRLKAEARTSA